MRSGATVPPLQRAAHPPAFLMLAPHACPRVSRVYCALQACRWRSKLPKTISNASQVRNATQVRNDGSFSLVEAGVNFYCVPNKRLQPTRAPLLQEPASDAGQHCWTAPKRALNLLKRRYAAV